MKRRLPLAIAALLVATTPSVAWAKEVKVRVDARSAPWSTGMNRKLAFGLANAKPATVVWNVTLLPGIKLTFAAKGNTTTVIGGELFGPDGQQDWTSDRGAALFPSHYISAKKGPVHLNELVGCFIDADGSVVGEPFAIGSAREVTVPEGASALSLGINDDNYSDNTGGLEVTIHVPEPRVIVENSGDEK